MVIYIFQFPAGWVKMGVAKHCPSQRLERGFWNNRHPPELCNRLDEVRLLHLFEGGVAEELALHAALVPDCGEFYLERRLPEIVHRIQLTQAELILPQVRYPVPAQDRMKSGCCKRAAGLVTNQTCNRPDHEERGVATRGKKAPCHCCGKLVSVRFDKIKQHQKTQGCMAHGR